jgi:hypothetical protein
LPPGIPRLYATSFPFQIYQLPNRIIFVFEGGAHMWRVVYTDGRKHTPPDKLNPTYLGEGIGHWEGDTLVVDVTGFNDRSWIDAAGHPHTEQLHVIERFTRVNELILSLRSHARRSGGVYQVLDNKLEYLVPPWHGALRIHLPREQRRPEAPGWQVAARFLPKFG